MRLVVQGEVPSQRPDVQLSEVEKEPVELSDQITGKASVLLFVPGLAIGTRRDYGPGRWVLI
jgi:hypothetical protein